MSSWVILLVLLVSQGTWGFIYWTPSRATSLGLNGLDTPFGGGYKRRPLASSVESARTSFAESFIAQKNFILLEKLTDLATGPTADTCLSHISFCDESFDAFLGHVINCAPEGARKELLGKVRYEINTARQKKLIEADKTLRGILSSGGLKQMEAKLAFHLRRAEIDMAFMVILQLNIEDAIKNKVEKAVQVMTHLETLINEYQDQVVSRPVRLLRLLLREDDPMVRKQMLRQKLLEVETVAAASPEAKEKAKAAAAVVGQGQGNGQDGATDASPTSVPQCEHIVVSAVQSWGSADVRAEDLKVTITDVLMQMTGSGGDQANHDEMREKCAVLESELQEVLAELTAPKVSDMCDEEKEKLAASISAPTEALGGGRGRLKG